MAQIKIYGRKKALKNIKSKLSNIIHDVIVDVLKFPRDKRYHRFITLDDEDMIFPDDKSRSYMIIEIMMMYGRSQETKKQLIKTLFQEIEQELNIVINDIEICIIESPACNWGFRGQCGDEIALNYKVEI
ncbi:MAG: tautomerase family protein [Campylobacterales bacterium]|nr:tautomerase family protein [Campylobacterales bacterium]